MLTKNQAKLVKSLADKKNRVETELFLVEGAKSVLELLNSDFQIDLILITDEFFEKHGEQIRDRSKEFEIVRQEDLEKSGTLETNDSALAVVKQRSNFASETKNTGIILALDEIKDPGNLGTIVRIADWYGVKNIIASKNTVDFYNPKVIAASKGSFTRVNMFYTDLKEFLPQTHLPIFGAFLNGGNIHQTKFPDKRNSAYGQRVKRCKLGIGKICHQQNHHSPIRCRRITQCRNRNGSHFG